MRSPENLTTLIFLRHIGEALVENKLQPFLNQFNLLLGECRDEYDYFALMVATGILNRFCETQFRKDLLDSSPEEMEDYVALKEATVSQLYQNYTKEVCS